MDVPQATPQMDGTWPRPLTLHDDPLPWLSPLNKPIEAPHTGQGCGLPPCGLPRRRSVRPSGWEDETHGQRVRGYTEIPLLFSLLGLIWSEGFTTAAGTQCFLFRDFQGLVGFTAVRHPFTRKRGLCGHARGHLGQGSGSGTHAGDLAWEAGRTGP